MQSTDDATRKLRSGSREPLLRVESLSVRYQVRQGLLRRKVGEVEALEGIDLRLLQGQTTAVVGEPGSGKTTLADAIVRAVTPSSGRLHFEGKDVLAMRRAELRAFRDVVQRWSDVEPLPSDLLSAVRASLASETKLIIFDCVLDAVPERARAVFAELRRAQDERGLSCLVLSRDLRLAAALADEVAVLLAGRIVENGSSATLGSRPQHPYTQYLSTAGAATLSAVTPLTSGCRFRERCPHAFARCAAAEPSAFAVPGGTSRCFLHDPGSVDG